MNEDAASYCRLRAREHDADAYLAALFAPEPKRGDLWALQAFAAELAQVPLRVSEPMLGEIRLQWWREALERLFAGATEPHPVVEALAGALSRAPLPQSALMRVIDAHALELHPAAIDRAETLGAYVGAVGTDLLRLAVTSLEPAANSDAALSELIETGGPLLGLARLLRRLPLQAAQGRVVLSAELLQSLGPRALAAQAALRAFRERLRASRRPALLPAFLPLSAIGPGLAAAARGTDPLRPVRHAPVLSQLRLLRAALRGRI